jgi:signal transduction histidine kinase
MATSVGLFSGYIQELYVRRSYVSQKIIEAKNEDLKELLVEADKANRSKNEFLATMSHELRTPLNAIIGFSDILRKQSFGPLGHARYAEYIQDINASGSHLLAIINDILDLAKAEAGKLQLREDETDLVQCLQNCVQMCRGRADDGGVQLNLWFAQPEIYALVDERLLLQLMLNLISNAIKFTPSGGSIQINLQANWRDGILIDVIDTGIGISNVCCDLSSRSKIPFRANMAAPASACLLQKSWRNSTAVPSPSTARSTLARILSFRCPRSACCPAAMRRPSKERFDPLTVFERTAA